MLWLDPDKILQALQIILDNAVRYSSSEQQVELSVEVAEQCLIRVQDHGIGISSQDLPHVFDRYFRADNARQIRPDGLGIGLSLCQTLVQSQHGELKLSSDGQQGTCVTVSLPLVEEENTCIS